MSLLACLFACLLACSLVADVLCLLPPSLPPPILLLSLTANLPSAPLAFFFLLPNPDCYFAYLSPALCFVTITPLPLTPPPLPLPPPLLCVVQTSCCFSSPSLPSTLCSLLLVLVLVLVLRLMIVMQLFTSRRQAPPPSLCPCSRTHPPNSALSPRSLLSIVLRYTIRASLSLTCRILSRP